jgi:hypothetical protein
VRERREGGVPGVWGWNPQEGKKGGGLYSAAVLGLGVGMEVNTTGVASGMGFGGCGAWARQASVSFSGLGWDSHLSIMSGGDHDGVQL